MWLTSNKPAAARVCRCSLITPSGILHRHLIARKRHHLGAKSNMKVIELCALQIRHRSPFLPAIARRAPAGQKPCPLAPPLSFRLRSLSLRRPDWRGLSRVLSARRSLGLRVYRGGCSFGTGTNPDFSRRVCQIVTSLCAVWQDLARNAPSRQYFVHDRVRFRIWFSCEPGHAYF